MEVLKSSSNLCCNSNEEEMASLGSTEPQSGPYVDDAGGSHVEEDDRFPGSKVVMSEFQDGEALSESGRYRRLHVEECYFEPILAPTRHA
ncbi:hypothetical protein ACFX2C_038603 [Malus domestica]